MKILYLIHQFYPTHHAGTEKFLLNLATTMQKWGHKVKVISYSSHLGERYDWQTDGIKGTEYLYRGIDVLSLQAEDPPHDLHYGIGNPALSNITESILREEGPDIFHITHPMRMSEFALSAARMSIPYILTMTDFFLMCPKCTLITDHCMLCLGPAKGKSCEKFCPSFQPEMIKRRLALAEEILSNASLVVAPSKFLGSLFQREFPHILPKIIPYGIDFSRINVNRRKYTGSEDFIVLYAGQIDYHKGVHVLIDAVKRVKAANLRLKLYGAGPEASVRSFKDLAMQDPRIEFCGVYAEDKIGEVFDQADIVVLPSNWHENNTIVMREAIASHIPCVVSSAGGMMEKIRDGVNGFVFRMGDSVQLQFVLERLLADPELLASAKRNMLRTNLITIEQEAFAYEREYNRLLSSGGNSRMAATTDL